MSIVDQHGKPFKTDRIAAMAASILSRLGPPPFLSAAPLKAWVQQQQIDQLRESCGLPKRPATIVFRRSSPFRQSAPAVDPAKWAEDCEIYSGRTPEGSAPTESV